jgi:hypothetical protein
MREDWLLGKIGPPGFSGQAEEDRCKREEIGFIGRTQMCKAISIGVCRLESCYFRRSMQTRRKK